MPKQKSPQKHPYCVWRDGRPRFNPGPRERAAGFVPEDLKHPDGRWFTREEMCVEAQHRLAEILARRASLASIGHKRPVVRDQVRHLMDDFLTHNDFKSERTRRDYTQCVRVICFQPQTRAERVAKKAMIPEPFAELRVKAVDAAEVNQFVQYVKRTRGVYTARRVRSVLQAAWGFARGRAAWRGTPWIDFSDAPLNMPKPKRIVWTIQEIACLLRTADRLGRPSIGDGVLLGFFTGQRQTDRIALVDRQTYDEEGRRVFEQSKTGAIVLVREHPVLAARLADARARVAAIAKRRGIKVPAEVIIDERFGRPYDEFSYPHEFDKVRREAAKECPSLAEKKERMLRATCVTYLSRAQCTPQLIAQITGHTLASVTRILETYIAAKDAAMSDIAMGHFTSYLDRTGHAMMLEHAAGGA